MLVWKNSRLNIDDVWEQYSRWKIIVQTNHADCQLPSITHMLFWKNSRLNIDDFWDRVSCETNFDTKQPKLEPKLVSKLSETRRLFNFGCFGSISKQRVSVFRLKRNKKKTTETNRKKCWNSYNFCPHWVGIQSLKVSPQSHRRNLQTQGKSTLRFQPMAKK
jgi:hypothetical protein